MHILARLLPALALMLSACASHQGNADSADPASPTLRVATYNTSLYDEEAGGLVRRLEAGDG